MSVNENRKNSLIGSFQLTLAAVIWGTAFVAQSVGTEYVEAFTFNFARSLLACIFLLLLVLSMNWKKSGRTAAESGTGAATERSAGSGWTRGVFAGGFFCGLALFAGMATQQIGIAYTSVGKAGFITAMYIVLVPVVGVFFGRKTGIKLWIGVVLAVIGLYMLCVNETLSVNKGDVIICGSALAYTAHILTVDHFSPKVDGIKLSCVQFFVCGFVSFICMVILEHPQMDDIIAAWIPVTYAGVMSSGVAYTLQIVGQARIKPTLASLIMSLESVVSALAGWVILGQSLSVSELAGCALIFAAIILAQLPGRKTTVLPMPAKSCDLSAGTGKAGKNQ